MVRAFLDHGCDEVAKLTRSFEWEAQWGQIMFLDASKNLEIISSSCTKWIRSCGTLVKSDAEGEQVRASIDVVFEISELFWRCVSWGEFAERRCCCG